MYNQAKYEFDIVSDYPLAKVLQSLTDSGITIEKYVKNGPGGGNQQFIVSAPNQQQIDNWCRANGV